MMFAPDENDTMPTRVPGGTASMNARAAARAASQRVGAMSRARIEPEVSMQIITMPSRVGTWAMKRGPASEMASVATPISAATSIAAAGRRDGFIAHSAKSRLE